MLSPVAGSGAPGRFSCSGAFSDSPAGAGTLARTSSQTDRRAAGEQLLGGPSAQASEGKTYSREYVITCLVGYCMSFIVFGSQVSILGPTIAALADKLGVEEPDLSPLFTALGVSCIVSGTPSGWLVDRIPTHHVLLGSLLVEVCPHEPDGRTDAGPVSMRRAKPYRVPALHHEAPRACFTLPNRS